MKRERTTRQYIGKQEVIVVKRAIEPRGAQEVAPETAQNMRRNMRSGPKRRKAIGILAEVAATLAYSGRFPAEWWRA